MTTKSDKSSERAKSTAGRVADAAREAAGQAADGAGRAGAGVKRAAGEVQAKLEDTARAGRERGEAAAGQVQAVVREHPLASLGVAFLAGALLASLMRR